MQVPARVVILVANPITYDGRVRRHASTLAEAGYDVCVVGVIGPNDRDEPPLSVLHGDCAGPQWRWQRIDRRRGRLGSGLRWLTSAGRQRAAAAGFGVARRLVDGGDAELSAAGLSAAGLAQLAGLAVATSAPELAWAAIAERPSLIYANDLDTLPAAAWAAWQVRVPFVYDAHEVYVDEHPALSPTTRQARAQAEGYFARRAAAVLTVNRLIADDLRQRYGLAMPAVVRNLPQGDAAAAVTPPAHRPLGQAGMLHILYHGAHIGLSQHGVDDLLRALARLAHDRAAPLRLLLTLRGGLSSSEELALRRRIEQLAITPQVRLLPPVPGAEALVRAAVADGADVGLAVHPPLCLSYVYTTSSKVYEYQLAGLAVVASDVTGNRHSIAPGAGLFYPAGDDQRLAACLRELSLDHGKLRTMQQAAFEYGQRSLRWQDERLELVAVIERALRRG